MKQNEFYQGALIYGIITLLGSVFSVINLFAICTTQNMISTGIEHEDDYEANPKLLLAARSILLLSIITTTIVTIIYIYLLK